MILNELNFAENVLSKHNTEEKDTVVLSILAKYYLHYKNLSDDEIESKLDDFMKKHSPDYDYYNWESYFKSTIKFAHKRNLITIDYIPITLNELNTIGTIKSKPLQRLAFSILCHSKYFNIINESNNNWVNSNHKDIFASAHVNKNTDEQYLMFHDLFKLGLINIGKNISKLNIQVNFIDNDGEIALKISDFRDLGYEYLLYKGENYVHCPECERLFKQNKQNNKVYCSKCGKYEKLKIKLIKCIEIDCGRDLVVDACDTKTKRCVECQKIKDREKTRLRVQKYRNKQNM